MEGRPVNTSKNPVVPSLFLFKKCLTILAVVDVDADHAERMRPAGEHYLHVYEVSEIYATQEDWLLDVGQDVLV